VTHGILVAIEATPKKAFATALDWPGWSRSGKSPDLAREALAAAAGRYVSVASTAGEDFPSNVRASDLVVIEEAPGGSGTDFGVPSRITDADRRPTSTSDAERLRRLVKAAWATFDRVAASAPAELRKGPRGGGRDRDKIVSHVVESDDYYAREIGIRLKPTSRDDPAAIAVTRAAMLDVLGTPSDGPALAGRTWTARYAASRIAWHALDHAWEIEDRTDPV
jgi:hypothetical protein